MRYNHLHAPLLSLKPGDPQRGRKCCTQEPHRIQQPNRPHPAESDASHRSNSASGEEPATLTGYHSFLMPVILPPTCSSFGCSDLAPRPRARALRTKAGQPIHRLLSFHPASLPMLEGEPVPKSGFKKPSFLLLPPRFPSPTPHTSLPFQDQYHQVLILSAIPFLS